MPSGQTSELIRHASQSHLPPQRTTLSPPHATKLGSDGCCSAPTALIVAHALWCGCALARVGLRAQHGGSPVSLGGCGRSHLPTPFAQRAAITRRIGVASLPCRPAVDCPHVGCRRSRPVHIPVVIVPKGPQLADRAWHPKRHGSIKGSQSHSVSHRSRSPEVN